MAKRPENKPDGQDETVSVERPDGTTVEFRAYRVRQDAHTQFGSRFAQGETLSEVLVRSTPQVDDGPVVSSRTARRRYGGLF